MSVYNGNIKPFWWGPKMWCSIFSFVAVYPEKPDNKVIEGAKAFFSSLKCVITQLIQFSKPSSRLIALAQLSSRSIFELSKYVNTLLFLIHFRRLLFYFGWF